MGGSICNYNKSNQCIQTSYTNLPIIEDNYKSNKKHTYKYYSNLIPCQKDVINNLSKIKENSKSINMIKINKDFFKSKNNSSSDIINNLDTNNIKISHQKNIITEIELEKIKSDIIKKFNEEIKQFAEVIPIENFHSIYNSDFSLKQIHEFIQENFNDDICNKKFRKTFSQPPLLFKQDKSIYKGSFNFNGKKEGFGILIDSSGNKYIGEWKNDLFHGLGILLSKNGDFYQGDFIKGKMEGSGVFYSSQCKYNYIGEFLENKFDGKGKITYEGHDLYNYYEGNFSEGYKHGSGNLVYKDGSCYKGNFDKNNFEGNGIFIFSDGRKYNGTWKKNKMDGSGVFTWEDGTKYKGQYKNNIKEGNGVYSFGANLYDGTWVDNLPHGQGMLLNEGLRIEGIFRYGKLVEIIKSKSANKNLFLVENINNCETEAFKNQGFYLSQKEDNTEIFQKCYKSCSLCNKGLEKNPLTNEENHNCIQCANNYYRLFDYFLIYNCYGDEMIEKGYRLVRNHWQICYESCDTCSSAPTFDNKNNLISHNCLSCYEGYNFIYQTNDCANETFLEKGYYLDDNDNFYKKCDISCATCDKYSNSINPKCKKCNNDLLYFKAENLPNDICYNKSMIEEINEEYVLSERLDDEGNSYSIWGFCYKRCTACLKLGNDFEHGCTACIPQHYLIYNTTNCVTDNEVVNNGYYFNKTLLKYVKCDDSCINCFEGPNQQTTNCKQCNNDKEYFSIEGKTNTLCRSEQTIEEGYYLNILSDPPKWK